MKDSATEGAPPPARGVRYVPSQRYMGPKMISLADVVERPIENLWRDTLPIGEVTTLEGDPEAGKSWVCLAQMAELSRQKVRSLYVCNEDDPGSVVTARMRILGADMEYVNVIQYQTGASPAQRIMLPYNATTAAPLRAALKEWPARLVIFNPVTSFFPPERNINIAQHVRPVMEYLAALAKEEQIAAEVVRHFARRRVEDAVGTRGMGSVDLTGAVRCSWYVVPHPDWEANGEERDWKQKLLVQSKSNNGVEAHALAFELRTNSFAWFETRHFTATEAVAQTIVPTTPESRQLARDCAAWLEALFKAHGQRRQLEGDLTGAQAAYDCMLDGKYVLVEANAAGFSAAVVKAARSRARIAVAHERDGHHLREWWWKQLPRKVD